MKHKTVLYFIVIMAFLCFTKPALADDVNYTRSSRRNYTVFHQVTVKNNTNSTIYNITVQVPLAPKSNLAYQDFIGEELNPTPKNITINSDGERMATYVINKLAPGQSVTLEQRLGIASYAVNYNIIANNINNNYNISDIGENYLLPEDGIEVDNYQIVAYAQNSTRGLANPYLIARRLFADINLYMTYSDDTTAGEGALNALLTGTGNCEDYADLLVATLRALNIPARKQTGYLYLPLEHTGSPYVRSDGTLQGDLLRHTWVEFYLSDIGWVLADPTFTYTVEVNGETEKILDWDRFASVSKNYRYITIDEGSYDDNNISYTYNGKEPTVIFTSYISPILDISPFSDIVGHWTRESVIYLYYQTSSIVAGINTSTYGVNEPLTRAQMAALFNRVFNLSFVEAKGNVFSDVSESHWAADDIATLTSAGFLNGYPDGSFKPNQPATRAEFAAILASLANLPRGTETPFTDLNTSGSSWAADAIANMYQAGLAGGVTATTFEPASPLTRGEAAVFLQRYMQSAYYAAQ